MHQSQVTKGKMVLKYSKINRRGQMRLQRTDWMTVGARDKALESTFSSGPICTSISGSVIGFGETIRFEGTLGGVFTSMAGCGDGMLAGGGLERCLDLRMTSTSGLSPARRLLIRCGGKCAPSRDFLSRGLPIMGQYGGLKATRRGRKQCVPATALRARASGLGHVPMTA